MSEWFQRKTKFQSTFPALAVKPVAAVRRSGYGLEWSRAEFGISG
ncbi:Uncharacterised protein [Vibrio cholerae]|nr:Uncharacterised protein [Vibrio cholerae]CSD13078.1 Uncharacterised protein [Vibrio cholerae]CSI84063.1 Uncharacterised protein [Vibrio cholerae]